MPGSVREARHRLTAALRDSATRAITGMPPERFEALSARMRSGPAPRALLRVGARLYERAPISISGGIGYGLLVSTPDLPLDHAHAGLIARGSLEPPVQEAMRRLLAPGDVFFDVGANVGFFTIIGAHMVGPEGRVVAFEPVPACAQAVRNNVAINGFAQAEVREEAVAAASGRARLCVVGEASWSHLSSTGHHADVRDEIEVVTASIDELVAAGAVPPPDVVKIDTEGAELEVLDGMLATLAAHRPALICELHNTNAQFVARMEQLGYATTNLDGPAPVAEAGPVHALAQPAGR